MGREIRKVLPNYVHPVWTKDDAPHPRAIGEGRSLYDCHITTAMDAWLTQFDRVRRGEYTDFEREYLEKDPAPLATWIKEFDRPPDPKYHRPWKDEEGTWFQCWENVSEGCPVSPPFATEDELIAYLAENGDFWDQTRAKEGRLNPPSRTKPGWGLEAARAFVKAGSAPSMMAVVGAEGTRVVEAKDIPLELERTAKS